MKKNKEKDDELKKAQNLESMLGLDSSIFDINGTTNIINNNNNNSNNTNQPLPPISNLPRLDLMDELNEAQKEAEKIIDSIIEFYFDPMSIKLDYVKKKRDVEIKTLTNILFQQKSQRYAIMKLLDNIQDGECHPRNFEVLATLQSGMMNTVKHQSAYMEVLENGIKKLKQEHEFIDSLKMKQDNLIESGDGVKKIGDGGIKSRGTKDLIESLKGEIEDVKFEIVGESKTDAKKKFHEELEREIRENENNQDINVVDPDLF